MPADTAPFPMGEAPLRPTPAWGFVEGPPRPLPATLWLRVRLWAGIVGRGWHAGRLGPVEAWRVAARVHPWRERVKRWTRVGGGEGRDA